MLQASEYKINDYLMWLHRVNDFGAVEIRKKLVRSSKTLLLLTLGWIIWPIIIIIALWLPFVIPMIYGYILGAFLVLMSPFVVSYTIVVPLLVVQFFIQRPIEFIIIRRARKTLARHKAIKIAIAGSFGKTSMREILKTVLSEDKKVAAPPNSYNTPLGISKFIKTLKGDEKILIFELGEYYPGDVRKLCKLVCPDIGVITGVNEAHLQKFKTLEKTVKTIFELADFLGTKPVYINGESDLARENAQPNHIIYSHNGVNGWKIQASKSDLSGTSFLMVKNEIPMKIKSSLLGLHQIGPLAATVDIARRIGLTPEQIRMGISRTKPFDHRLECKTDKNGVTILDDSYNGNPNGVKAVISFLASLKGRRFYVTPGLVEMGSRTQEVHKEMGCQLANAGIEHVVLIKNSVTPFIEQGLQKANYTGEILWFNDALSAFAALPHITINGDIVLLQNDWPDQYV
jgi:UDP-N-acetylmuramoyl-tripeptide--D-alanyl-D-alanine ligase